MSFWQSVGRIGLERSSTSRTSATKYPPPPKTPQKSAFQKPEVRTPPASGAQEKIVSFSESNMCSAIGVPNPRVYSTRTHKIDHVRTLKILQSMWWSMETRKDPACTLISYGWVERICCSWLSLGRSDLNFPWDKFRLGQQSVQNTNTNAEPT